MAFLFNKEKNKYIELNLFTTNEKDWITYSMCGGNIVNVKPYALTDAQLYVIL